MINVGGSMLTFAECHHVIINRPNSFRCHTRSYSSWQRHAYRLLLHAGGCQQQQRSRWCRGHWHRHWRSTSGEHQRNCCYINSICCAIHRCSHSRLRPEASPLRGHRPCYRCLVDLDAILVLDSCNRGHFSEAWVVRLPLHLSCCMHLRPSANDFCFHDACARVVD